MQQRTRMLMGLVLACCVAGVAWGGPPAATSSHSSVWEHGKYLVQRVGICSDCHTPRDHHGRLIAARALQGARIDFTPVHPIPGWADHAPAIAGLPDGWTFEQMVNFLETGTAPDGSHAGPPMPPFRFNADDARAIATYLQSLPKASAKAPSVGGH